MSAINSNFFRGVSGSGVSGYYPSLYNCKGCGMLFHCSQDRDYHQYACQQQKTALASQMQRDREIQAQARWYEGVQDQARQQLEYLQQTYNSQQSLGIIGYSQNIETEEDKKKRLEEEKRKKRIHMQIEDYPKSAVTATYKNKEYFETNGYCVEHSDYHCEDCALACLESGRTSLLPAIIAQPQAFQSVDKIQMRENFEDQVRFIKKALNLSDAQMDKVKVKDIGKKMDEAKNEITVGQMKDLIKERIKMPGFIQSFFRWVGSFRV